MTPQYVQGQNPNIDLSIWDTTLRAIGGFFRSLGNEFLEALQAVIPDDRGAVTTSYEKTVHIVQIDQHAPSDYARGITKDACARDHRAVIKSGNLTGRVWSGFDQTVIEEGADGIAVGEIDIENNGAYQPEFDTPTTKIYHFYTKGGKFPATAVGFIEGEEATRYGWVARQNAFTPDGFIFALLKRDSNEIEWAVRGDGTMVYRGREVQPKRLQLADGTTADVLTLQ